MKIYAIKSLDSLVMGIPELVEEVVHILETLSMNYLPREVKMFVKNCDITAHQYNQRTFIGASDSMLGFCGGHFPNIDNYQLNPEWEGSIVRHQKIEPKPAAATYTSLDDKEDGYNDNCISKVLCGTGPVN